MKTNLNGIEWLYTCEEGLKWLASNADKEIDVREIKIGAHRGVYRHTDGLYIKIFHYPFFRSIRPTRFSKACKDGANLLSLQKIGITTPKVLAFGEDRKHKILIRDVLITEELASIQSLPEFITNIAFGMPLHQKLAIIGKFAELIKKLHESGIYHRDINFGNIFIEMHEAEYRFVLLDVDKVKYYPKSLTPKKQIQNLGELLQMFWPLTNVNQRFYFLSAYGWQKESQNHFLRKIEKYAHKANYKRGSVRYRKCLSDRAGFIMESIGDFVVHRLRLTQTKNVMDSLISDLKTNSKNYPAGYSTQEFPMVKIMLDGKTYILKRYSCSRRYSFPIKTYNTQATHTWCMAWGGFLTRGIRILRPLLFMRAKPRALQNPSYILFEYIENAETIDTIWPNLELDERRKLLIGIGVFLGYMHRSGCTHGNLTWKNILVDPNKAHFQFFLQNIERGQMHRRLALKAAINDLSDFLSKLKKLDPSKANIEQFIGSYEKRAGFGKIAVD